MAEKKRIREDNFLEGVNMVKTIKITKDEVIDRLKQEESMIKIFIILFLTQIMH